MNTHESYVSIETAKMLKEAGFDWKVMSFYTNDITEGCESEYELRLVKFDNWNGKNKTWCDLVSAPTLDVAQRWLLEVKKMCIVVFPVENRFTFIIVKLGEKFNQDDYILEYNTYKEAKEAGIKRALEIILEKGK